MAIEFTPLLKSPSLPLLPAGIEMMILESSVAVPSLNNEPLIKVRQMTAMV